MKKDNTRIEKVIRDMSFALNHIEDMVADNRAILIKLVKQNNSIVEFLRSVEQDVEEYEETETSFGNSSSITNSNISTKKVSDMKKLVDDILKKTQDLKDFEEELKKHKDKLTPGQMGES
tara:strand:+ start:349 stop:708 length:360 start_codon:yes stop_codon:yes gene_type:complete